MSDASTNAPAAVATEPFSAVVLIYDFGRILGVGRKEGDGWSLPGGKLEPGETPAEGAARELREETGVMAPVGALLWLYEGPSVVSGRKVATYFAQAWSGKPKQQEEGMPVAWIGWEELLSGPFGAYYKGLKEAWDLHMSWPV